VLAKYPSLAANGFDPRDGLYLHRSEGKKSFNRYRQMLIEAECVVLQVSGIFARLPLARRLNYDRTSYSVKHLLEELLGVYVPHGACIAAAYMSGMLVKRCEKTHPAAYLGLEEEVVEGLEKHVLLDGGRGVDGLTEAFLSHLHTPSAERRRQRTIGQALRFQIMKRDNYRCRLCGISASDGEHVRLEVDHIIARANAGTNDPSNLWLLCCDCNHGKGVHEL
jgi:hypothetical protein